LTVNVPGAAQGRAELRAFRAQRVPLTALGYQIPTELPLYDSGPVNFRVQVLNAGNLQLSPSGKVVLTDLFGNTAASLDLPTDQVFPGDTATFVASWTSPPAVGVFNARLSLQAGEASLVADERLVVLPWQQVLAAALFLLALRLLLGNRFSLPIPVRRRTTPAVAAAGTSNVLRAHVSRYSDQPIPTAERALPAGAPLEPGAVVAEPVGTVRNQAAQAAEPAASPTPAPESPPAAPSVPAPAGHLNGRAEQLDVLEMLHWGQQAARNGERLVAYRIFVHVVEIDPRNEEAWLWRAATAADPHESRQCLERVLQLNPNNPRAHRGLEALEQQFAQRGV
jgi:hypothetical protein